MCSYYCAKKISQTPIHVYKCNNCSRSHCYSLVDPEDRQFKQYGWRGTINEVPWVKLRCWAATASLYTVLGIAIHLLLCQSKVYNCNGWLLGENCFLVLFWVENCSKVYGCTMYVIHTNFSPITSIPKMTAMSNHKDHSYLMSFTKAKLAFSSLDRLCMAPYVMALYNYKLWTTSQQHA